MELYTAPPDGSTVICADELGPVIPRTFPPAPGWSPGGHRIKAPLEYARGPDKTWVYGGLRVRDGQAVTMCAASRNSVAYQDFLARAEQANPEGTIYVITDNLSSHDSKSTRAWLEDHPRIRPAFIPRPPAAEPRALAAAALAPAYQLNPCSEKAGNARSPAFRRSGEAGGARPSRTRPRSGGTTPTQVACGRPPRLNARARTR